MASKEDKRERVYCPRLGTYYKVDLNEGAPAFSGTPKDIILAYKHWIKIAKKNLGKITINDVELTVKIVNMMTIRVNELMKNYSVAMKRIKTDKLNKIAERHWNQVHLEELYKQEYKK